jgi:sugar/nucleoside kinase (ribokinase family)
MAACARLGLRTKYVGAIGSGRDGSLVRAALERAGVDLEHLAVHDAVNRFAVVLLDERTGERVVLWDFDERLALEDAEIPAEALASARVVHVDDGDQRAAVRAARIAASAGVTVTSDIDQVGEHTKELIASVTIAIFAEHVPADLQGGRREALVALPRRRDQTFCVTLGTGGALALDNDGLHYGPAFEVRAADTTAAGDVFRAGFIYALLQGWNLDERLRFANAAAAISCTRPGAIDSVPSLEEVRRLIGGR